MRSQKLTPQLEFNLPRPSQPREPAGPRQTDRSFGEDMQKVLTVSELTRRIKSCLENNIAYVWVEGEVSNLRTPVSGHTYFSLKDELAQIRCVLFAGTAREIKFKIENGMALIIFGRVSVYEKSGEYQIIVDRLEPKGIGVLQLAFEQLKTRLTQEGLFESVHKKSIPLLPQRIGIITSPTGAALKDILNIIDRRFPEVSIIIYPVKVQGEGACAEIAQAIKDLNSLPDIDVLVLTRGGGSLEDLWAFNEEIVARSIFASKTPVISAVGHEIDLTISDLVADKRALTPSEAGELVLPVKKELLRSLDQSFTRLSNSLRNRLVWTKTRLDALKDSYIFQEPFDRLRQYQQRMDELLLRLTNALRKMMEQAHENISQLVNRLETLSPLQVLQRGYSITKRERDDRLLVSTQGLRPGENVITQLAQGRFISKVEKIL